jgi:hypothetical protein
MPNETIGYKPEIATKLVTLAEMPKPRNTESKAEASVTFIKLNPIDQRLSAMPDGLYDAIASRMATKGVSGLDLSTNL